MPKPKRTPPPPVEPKVYSIKDFCTAHGIGYSTYALLRARRQAPREMRIGRRRYISYEAAAEWRRKHERAQ